MSVCLRPAVQDPFKKGDSRPSMESRLPHTTENVILNLLQLQLSGSHVPGTVVQVGQWSRER